MGSMPADEEGKRKQTKRRKVTASSEKTARILQKQAAEKHAMVASSNDGKGATEQNQVVMTEDELRALVARKAYELYERRRAVNEADDWLEAERLVKEQLLAEGQCAGSV